MTKTTFMSDNDADTSLGDRPEWILRMLYAPSEGRTAAPIIGITRLMKACFLMWKKLESEENISSDFEFKPADYGPLDEEVYLAVEELEEKGLIDTRKSDRYNGKEFRLTNTGYKRAKELFNEISGSEQELISWIKGKHVMQPLSQLLSFVYNRYPKYAENSKYTT